MNAWAEKNNRHRGILLFSMAAVLLICALFFSYQATDKTHFQTVSSEMGAGTDIHYAAPGKHLPVQKWLFSVLLPVLCVWLGKLPPKRLPAIPPAFLRAFIPLRLKALFLMPIKQTSLYKNKSLYC